MVIKSEIYYSEDSLIKAIQSLAYLKIPFSVHASVDPESFTKKLKYLVEVGGDCSNV